MISNPAPKESPAPNPDAPHAHLWESVRAALRYLLILFESPAALAGLGLVSQTTRAELLAWLLPIEHALRRLLALEARALAPSPQKSTSRRAERPTQALRPTSPAADRIKPDPDKPETWRVGFALGAPALAETKRRAEPPLDIPANVLASRRIKRPRLLPRGVHSAWPLARRFEAILRVIGNPAPFARRLARRLQCDTGLLPALAKPPLIRANALCSELLRDACALLAAPPPINTS